MEAIESMNVAQLKAELKARNLPTSGKKSELITRLQEHVPASSNETGDGKTKIKHAEGTRYFRLERLAREIYNILKHVAPDNGVANSVYETLDYELQFFFDEIVKACLIMKEMGHIKTLNARVLLAVVRIKFSGAIEQAMIERLTDAIARYTATKTAEGEQSATKEGDDKAARKLDRERAGLHVRPSLVRTLVENILRDDGASDVRISKSFPIALAAVLEEFLKAILEPAAANARIAKRVRVLGQHINQAIAEHPELYAFFVSSAAPRYAPMRSVLTRLHLEAQLEFEPEQN